MKKKYIIASSIVFLSFVFDQVTKYFVATKISHYESIPIIKDFFYLVNIENTGVTFGMLRNLPPLLKKPLLVFLPIIIAGFVIYLLVKTPIEEKLSTIAFSLILGGAIGNIFDRVRMNYVVDFLHFNLGFMWWPAFNIADAVIVCGMVLLGIEVIRGKKIV